MNREVRKGRRKTMGHWAEESGRIPAQEWVAKAEG